MMEEWKEEEYRRQQTEVSRKAKQEGTKGQEMRKTDNE
jgi:hypothetical protein